MKIIRRDRAIINLTRITVRPEHRTELWQTILSLIEPLNHEGGCLTYRFYEEAGDENSFVLIGEWETPEDWNQHLHSNNFAILLGSISLLCDPSPIEDFKLLSHATGIEAMTRAGIECHT